jgi:putative ABC transport system permease protein
MHDVPRSRSFPAKRELIGLATTIGLAVDSILAHKLRSVLTLLGIIIGVASVVVVGAAIEGLGVYAEESTAKAFGTESFLVAQLAAVGRLSRTERAEKLRYNKRIRRDDLEYLRFTTGDDIIYSPYRQTFDEVRRGNLTFEGAAILGVSAELAEIRDVGVLDGRFFTPQEEQNRRFVAMIGQEIVETLFPGVSPLGETVKIQGLDFQVIGVQEKLGNAGQRSQDNQVYIPYTAFVRLYGPGSSMAIFGRARPESGLTLEAALDVTRAALRSRFRTPPGAPDNFDTLTPDSIRSFVDSILGLIQAVVVPVTLISLVVGGIVIMNIMLVSVTERTREIGIRKSLGARHSDIMLQFLTEAVLLAIAGGAIGLLLGAFGAKVLSAALETALPVTLPYVALALVVSSLAGILSGWYPARRAARLDPIAALRAE